MTKHEQEIIELKDFFEKAQFPKTPFKLNKYMSITGDPQVMVDGEIRKIGRYVGSDIVLDSLFVHLRQFKELIESLA